MKKKIVYVATLSLLVAGATPVFAGAAQQQVLDHFKQLAGQPFSAERGKALFESRHTTGKPDTPSCTTCHSSSPLNAGQTRAGKMIEPMALSKSPDRYSDLAKVEKWFGRNCKSVLGRECTPVEKGDYLSFMMSQ